jgi:hypothetical protein
MFLTVVEYGKLRLVQLIHYIQRYVVPRHFKVLYSNIDNIIIVLANADTLEQAIIASKQNEFDKTKHLYFTSSINCTQQFKHVKSPGMAELKWIRTGQDNWKFITIRTQHYCLVADNDESHNVHKTSGWSNISSKEAFLAAQRILNGHMVDLMQTRRINKRSNMNTHQVQFLYT